MTVDEAAALADRRRELAKVFAEVFLAAITVLYATGFLTTFTFLERFGIRETGSEFLRLKYIYVGILYFLFPVTIVLPATALISLRRQAKREMRNKLRTGQVNPGRLRMPLASILLILKMLFVFYILICFAPLEYIHNRPWVVTAVSVPSILGAMLFRYLEDTARVARNLRRRLVKLPFAGNLFYYVLNKSRPFRRRNRPKVRRLIQRISRLPAAGRMFVFLWRMLLRSWHLIKTRARMILFFATIYFDKKALQGMWADLKLMFWGDSDPMAFWGISFKPPIGGITYFVFVILFFAIALRVYRRMQEHESQTRTKYLTMGAGVLASIFFISIILFSLRVYPFIPALKGGGDFRKAFAQIILKKGQEHPALLPDQPLTIIEETSSSFLIALPYRRIRAEARRKEKNSSGHE